MAIRISTVAAHEVVTFIPRMRKRSVEFIRRRDEETNAMHYSVNRNDGNGHRSGFDTPDFARATAQYNEWKAAL